MSKAIGFNKLNLRLPYIIEKTRATRLNLEQTLGLQGFVEYSHLLWLPHTEQAQGQPVYLLSTP